ncbi:MAG: hypothetical protein N5P05_003109 [Chroococcopsis gigantea SAG 12.99]|jgi:Zn-dependent protease with chaperone function|nr:M48 family metalloprotease [Chlorogloea purpurea SAG 13.99]MDV3001503.1 hypothetical protein [Chroococcopsis gigantea SAG 12.99]
MNYEKFENLIRRLEIAARRNPTGYKLQVGLLALGGYGYICLILAGSIGSIVGLVILMIYTRQANYLLVKLLLLLLIPVVITIRSLSRTFTVSFPAPEGLAVSRDDAPQLFALIDKLEKALDCPQFNHVKLTSDFNAAVVQVPRLGVLGWNENYLLIGLPLLQALSLSQFEAVLAHEFGHLSGNHSRFKGWIYQVRQTWLLLLERMNGAQQDRGFWSSLMWAFFNWYIPFFNAYSFVLARADEYEADRCAVQLTSTTATAGALVNVSVKSQWINQEFWQSIYEQVKIESEPPGQPFYLLGQMLAKDLKFDRAREWLESSLNLKTDFADTHPCLSDRLTALGVDPRTAPILLSPVNQTAASILGENLQALTEELNRQWQIAVRFQWKEKHSQFQIDQQRLQVLDEGARGRTLLIEEAWEQAQLTHEVRSESAAVSLLKNLIKRDENHVGANYLLGQILLSQQDGAGRDYLERAMAKDPYIYINACQLLCDFLALQGETQEVRRLRQKAEKHYEQILLAQQERSSVRPDDRFLPHDLSWEIIKDLRQQLTQHQEIKEAYLVRKMVKIFPEVPFYILAIVRRSSAWELNGHERDREMIDNVARNLRFRGEMWVTALSKSQSNLLKTIRRIEDSNIY